MKKLRFVSIQVKVFGLILLMLVLPLCVFGGVFYYQNASVNAERAVLNNLNAIEQKGMNLEYVFRFVQQNSLRIYQDESVKDYLLAQTKGERQQAYMQLNAAMQNMLAYDGNFAAISIRRMDGEQFSSSSAYKRISNADAGLIEQQGGNLVYMGDVQSRFDPQEDAYVFSRKINDINDLGKMLGAMQLYVRKSKIQGLFFQEESAAINRYYIVENGKVLISSDEEAEGKRLETFVKGVDFSQKQGSTKWEKGGSQRLVSYYRLAYPDWYLVNIMSSEQIVRQNHVFLQMLVAILILVVLAGGCAAFGLSAYVLAPLKEVAGAMKRLEKENFRLSVPVKGNDEIAILASNFNKMSRELDALVNQVYAAQVSEKNAQIKALQAYINPHFLYNTLDVICWMARMEDAEETCSLVEALSGIFRMSVHTGTRVLTVKEEIEYTKNYLKIQECRYADTIDFLMEIEPETENCETVSFVLQPLIENAIVYGVETREQGGTVKVRVIHQEERLVFMVEDDGLNADIEALQNLLETYEEGKRGMAISSVNSRIRLYYGDEYGLHFETNNPHGVRAVVEQPYRERGGTDGDKATDCG